MSAPSDPAPAHEAFTAWARSRGVKFHKAIALAQFADRGIGIVAQEAIEVEWPLLLFCRHHPPSPTVAVGSTVD